jgi:TPR repeat protein
VAQNPGSAFPQDLADKAEQGDTGAMITLGKAYWNGDRVPFDLEKARAWLDRAASKGALDAQMFLGMAYFSGTKLPKDRQVAARYLSAAADQGFPLAQYYVGMMYRHGAGLEKSDTSALKFLTLAANSGHGPAEYDLAIMYEGIGTSVDKKRACDLFAKASEQGHIAATNNLGHCYDVGDGIEKNPAKAMELYTKAAEAGNTKAQGNLAIMYGGLGDWEKSYFWLRIAETLGADQNKPAIEKVKAKLTAQRIDDIEGRIAEWRINHKQWSP